MIESAVLVYSVLASFVLSSVTRNRREAKPYAPMVVYVGWVLMGASFGGAALLGLMAVVRSSS